MVPVFPIDYLRPRRGTSKESDAGSVLAVNVRSLFNPLIGRFWRCVNCIHKLFCVSDPADEIEGWVMVTVQGGQLRETVKGETTPARKEMIEFD